MIDLNDAWYRISVKALIYNDDGDILLTQEGENKWDMPGGGLDHGETAQQGITREIFEEMGLEVIHVGKHPKYFLTTQKHNSKDREWIANICYEVKVRNLDFTVSDECTQIGFFNKRTIETIDIFENVEQVFENIEFSVKK